MVNNEDVGVFDINDGGDIDEGEDDVEDLLPTMNQIVKSKHKDIEEIISFLDEIIKPSLYNFVAHSTSYEDENDNGDDDVDDGAAALGLGAFVNFTNCRVSYPAFRVNVTSVWIDPYPFPLRQLKDIKITAETNHNITEGDLVVNTFSVPLVLNPQHIEFPLCANPAVTKCPVTAGPMVMNIPVLIFGADYYVFNQTMCVTFRYLVRDPEYNTDILAA
ncbi:unnamed protein product [Brassica oleracea]